MKLSSSRNAAWVMCLKHTIELVSGVSDKQEEMEVTPMYIEQNSKPLIGIGLESIIALTFAVGMFSLALLRPVLDMWLPF